MKKNKKKIIYYNIFEKFLCMVGIIVIFIFCSKISYVNAGENDSTLVKNRIDDIYASVILNGEQRFFYLNMYEMNGRVAYCIELGVDITTNIYNSTNDFYVTSFTNGQNNYIRTVSYYGYGYKDHTDYRYYMAAQELIWEYLSGVQVEWVQGTIDNNNKINIDSFKNKILSLYGNYNKTPAIYWKNGDYVEVGSELVLKDYANMLSEFEVVSSSHSIINIEGDNLIIKFSDTYLGKEEITLRKRLFYNNKGSFYYSGNSQKLISNGNINDILAKYTFNVEGVSFNGVVIDKDTLRNQAMGDATLKGAVYEVTDIDGNVIGIYETDDNGKFVVDNLLYGKYFIKQIEASEGYLVNDKIVEFELSKSGLDVYLEQKIISNNVEIMKVFSDENGKCFPESNVAFLVYDSKDVLYEEVITGADGMIRMVLPYGKYAIKQKTSNYGYDKVSDFEIIVSEVKDDSVRYDLVNNLIKTKLKVITKDIKTGDVFLSKEFSYKIKKKGSDNYLQVNGIDIFNVGDNGVLIFPMLFSYGDYVLEQISVPNGVILNDEKITFSINDKSNFLIDSENLLLEIEYFNEIMLGNININANEEVFFVQDNKYGYTKEKRSNISFSLIANDNIFVNDKLIYSKDDVVTEVDTNENGQAFIYGIYLGEYCLIDNSTNNKQCFILKNISSNEKVVEKTLEFTIILNKNDLIIKNLSSNGDVIKDSVFIIKNKSGKLIYRGITNEEGIVKVNNLVRGEYCFYQKFINDLYEKNDKEECVILNENKNINFYNVPKNRNKVLVPNTFSDGIDIFNVNSLMIILVGIGVFVYKKVF